MTQSDLSVLLMAGRGNIMTMGGDLLVGVGIWGVFQFSDTVDRVLRVYHPSALPPAAAVSFASGEGERKNNHTCGEGHFPLGLDCLAHGPPFLAQSGKPPVHLLRLQQSTQYLLVTTRTSSRKTLTRHRPAFFEAPSSKPVKRSNVDRLKANQ